MTISKCEDCIYFDIEVKKCIKNLNPLNCTEYKDLYEEYQKGWEEFCDWACENNIYDDVTKECDCWDVFEEMEEWEEEYEEDYWWEE